MFAFGVNYPGEAKRRTHMCVNFQAESVALPPDSAGAAGRPGQAIIATQPSWPDRH
jgi:hypothetical protein